MSKTEEALKRMLLEFSLPKRLEDQRDYLMSRFITDVLIGYVQFEWKDFVDSYTKPDPEWDDLTEEELPPHLKKWRDKIKGGKNNGLE